MHAQIHLELIQVYPPHKSNPFTTKFSLSPSIYNPTHPISDFDSKNHVILCFVMVQSSVFSK